MITTIIGNSSAPQFLDLKQLAGFALVIASAVGGGSAAPGAQYQHGTHAQAIHNAQNGTQIFHAISPKQGGQAVNRFQSTLPQYVEPQQALFTQPPTTPPLGMQAAQYTFGTHAKQIYDSQIQAQIFRPVVVESGGFFGAEYSFGTHQKAIIDSQIQAQVFKPAITPPSASSRINPRTLIAPPQELSLDLTLQGWVKIPSVSTGWLVTMVTAGPQLADLTQQAQLVKAQPFHSAAPNAPSSPTTIVAVWQQDITQIPASVSRPPNSVATFQPIRPIFASPDRHDYTQPQGQIIPTALPGPAKYVQPALVLSFEQQYDKTVYPVAFQQAIQIGGVAPVTTGFRVMAVTAGLYGNVYYVPGDVFDIVQASDYSDSSIDYQPPSSATTGFGWMTRVPQTTPLYVWQESNNATYFPAADPNRRFVF
jgi:hypothetical protein